MTDHLRLDKATWHGIGVGTPLRGQGSRARVGRLLTYEQLAAIYLDPYVRLARIVVDRIPEDCTREGFKIQVDDDADGVDPFGDELARLDISGAMRRADEKARLYGGAGIVMIIDDDGALDEPITGQVRGVKALHVFGGQDLRPVEWEGALEDENYGRPRMYSLRSRVPGALMHSPRVHADRVIPWYGLPVPDESTADFDGWGQSVLEAAYAVICDADTVTASTREAVNTFQYNVLRLKNLAAIVSGPDEENSALRSRIDWIEEGKRRTRHVVIDAEDGYDQHSTTFTGIVEAFQIFQQNFSAVTRIPVTLAFGQSPSGLSTDDQSGTRNYYDGIRAHQTTAYEPAIRRVVGLLADAGHGPASGWSVVFDDLMAPSDAEVATTNKTIAETDAINIMNGVYLPDEARGRYTVAGVARDLVLSADEGTDDPLYHEMMSEYKALGENGIGDPEREQTADDPPADGAGLPEREFNGAQISALRDVVKEVAAGELPEGGAIEILRIGFGLTREQAAAFFTDKAIRAPVEDDDAAEE